jgi:hypothetical protein
MLSADEAREAGGGKTEGAQDVDGGVKVLGVTRHLDDAAHVDAQELDLVLEVDGLASLEALELDGLEAAGVEAVLEVVGVAEGCTAAPFWFFGYGDGIGGFLGFDFLPP